MGEVELHCAKHLFDKSRLRFAAKISTLPSDVVPKVFFFVVVFSLLRETKRSF